MAFDLSTDFSLERKFVQGGVERDLRLDETAQAVVCAKERQQVSRPLRVLHQLAV